MLSRIGFFFTKASTVSLTRALPCQSLGTDWEERVLPSIGNEVVKAVVAQYNAEQLITQRETVSRMVIWYSCCCLRARQPGGLYANYLVY